MTTRPTRFQDLENLVCSARNAVLLAEMAFDGIHSENTDEDNMTSYALGRAREEVNRLYAAFYEASETARAEKRGGDSYNPTAEELAMARQATDFQTADEGFYENPGDSDEAQAA